MTKFITPEREREVIRLLNDEAPRKVVSSKEGIQGVTFSTLYTEVTKEEFEEYNGCTIEELTSVSTRDFYQLKSSELEFADTYYIASSRSIQQRLSANVSGEYLDCLMGWVDTSTGEEYYQIGDERTTSPKILSKSELMSKVNRCLKDRDIDASVQEQVNHRRTKAESCEICGKAAPFGDGVYLAMDYHNDPHGEEHTLCPECARSNNYGWDPVTGKYVYDSVHPTDRNYGGPRPGDADYLYPAPESLSNYKRSQESWTEYDDDVIGDAVDDALDRFKSDYPEYSIFYECNGQAGDYRNDFSITCPDGSLIHINIWDKEIEGKPVEFFFNRLVAAIKREN